jgi:dTDP-4-dehydrorhamnose reductase
MKILLFGCGGQVGWELQRSLSPLGEVIALDFDSAEHHADFSRPQELAKTVLSIRPDVVVNAAAHTAVDKAESEPDLAHTINAVAPGVIAKAAEQIGAWMVHYSTDYVFDGTGTRAWTEADTPAPLSVYGRTKLAGEQAVAQACTRHLIFRTSWVYASRGGNFAKTMLRLAQERERLTVIDDQWGAPTGADLLADVTAHALRHVQTHPQDAGLYHLVASGETNWFSYAKHVLAGVNTAQSAIKIIAKEIVPIPTSSFPTPAKRPHNSRLNTAKLQQTFGLHLPAWQQGVNRMLAEIL